MKIWERRVCFAPVVAFRGVIGSRPSVWEGRQPGGFLPANYNVGVSRGQNFMDITLMGSPAYSLYLW